MAGVILSARGLHFAWPGGGPVLAGIDLALDAGERVAILGDNGSGKTTLARALAGRLPVTGQLAVAGRAPEAMSPAERAATVQMVPQSPHLFLSGRAASVRAEIAFGPENLCLPRHEIAARTDEALALLALDALAGRPLRQLSGGELQRTAIAAALAMRPRLLILDEPFGDIDAQARAAFAARLGRVHPDLSLVVMAVGAQEGLADLNPRILRLQAGRLEQPA